MRRILFRGKTLDGRWIYGDLWQRPYAKNCVTIVSFMEDTGTTGGLEVIPETVGQDTGLDDKNGVNVFDGDVLIFDGDKFVISWDDERCGFFMDYWMFEEQYDLSEFWPTSEIIGNIHDNPELAEEIRLRR